VNASEAEITDIAGRIDRYLRSHPDAADSAEGILRWWLTRQRFDESVTKVEQALALLLRKGAVKKQVLIDGRVLYVGTKAHSMHDTH
jgi:hypothetical protein